MSTPSTLKEHNSFATPSTSWTLSGFGDEISPDPHAQIAVLEGLGARHIEVRSAWDTNVVDLDEDQLNALAAIVKNAQFSVSAIASPIGKVDVTLDPDLEVQRLHRIIRVAKTLGTTNIRIFSFYPAPGSSIESMRDDVLLRMRRLADVAEQAGVVLLHENEKGIYGDIPERILDIVESVGSANLRLAWDSANFVQVGVRPFDDGYSKLSPYVDYLQVKDALSLTSVVVPAGEGDGQLRETLAAFASDGYAGYASLEPHLSSTHSLGGFSGPYSFGLAARAFRRLTDELGIELR